MQVVSGALGKERVHFEAPAAERVAAEMQQFLAWFNGPATLDAVLKAGVAHLWFLAIHPFDDGNGRIARALADMLLARADGSGQRFYSLSAQLQAERKAFYTLLERTQRGPLDITAWLIWFMECLGQAVQAAGLTLAQGLVKAQFWQRHAATPLNSRQRQLLNRLLNGFEGSLTSSKWARMAQCSQDTATRDFQNLAEMSILIRKAGGCSTRYELADG